MELHQANSVGFVCVGKSIVDRSGFVILMLSSLIRLGKGLLTLQVNVVVRFWEIWKISGNTSHRLYSAGKYVSIFVLFPLFA